MSTRNTDPRNRDFETSINTRPATSDEIAYRDGYIRGKSAEQLEYERRRAAEARMHEENARLRADNGVSTGLILGLVLAAVAAVVGGIVYVSSTDGVGTVAPTPEATTPEATTPEPANETTVIERTIERTQEVVPAPSTVEPPEINVELNNPLEAAPATAPEAAPETAPEAAPSQPEAQDTQPQ
ncbi:hypothetical protein VB780_10140 [Leptolyngbya sp. CCNP1308]|uniref:hypothetical protein n=1 Tax=Leptolyngbya sp. CCNP1308 TaxID=3110255 RepID=UPI002B1EFE7B|nr:hypothetical protein [Leptolyngbya sp. CCNP1308]MEA5448928.1 hypothetical protein [Leptolyngbya sp. CCNP1308]